MDLTEKVVVITGATRGLGKILAKQFTKEHCKVVVSARTEDELMALAGKIHAEYFVADVIDERQVMDLGDFTVNKFGKIDVWINNAGIRIPHCPIEETDSKRFHEMMEVNLFGTFYGSKTALIHMKSQKSGVIINILSTSALEGRFNSAAYCASKYAAVGFGKSLRLEAEPHDISVIQIYPGGMKTNFFDEQKPKDYDEFMDAEYVAEKMIENLKKDKPKIELVVKRPGK